MDIRLECPSCSTQYTAERCGLSPVPGRVTSATIVCALCKTQFDVTLQPSPALGWFARTVLRRSTPSHQIRSVVR